MTCSNFEKDYGLGSNKKRLMISRLTQRKPFFKTLTLNH